MFGRETRSVQAVAGEGAAPSEGSVRVLSAYHTIRHAVRQPRVQAGLVALGLVAGYLLIARPLLMPSGRTVWVELGVLALLFLAFLVAVLLSVGQLVIGGVGSVHPRTRPPALRWLRRSGRSALVAAVLLAVFLLAAVANDLLTYALPLQDESGTRISGGIARLEKVRLGGTTQYITIRGRSVENPVLLFLAGGPGGSELVKTRFKRTGAVLEEHFVVVNWDQPGAGKSWNAVDLDELTPEMYVQHARELTDMLRQRFDEEKIYLLGDSWGSALGLMLADRYPELFHAYIGADQMVAFLENDLLEYQAAWDHATETGDRATLQKLEKNGRPPYPDNPTMKMIPITFEVAEIFGEQGHDTAGHNMLIDNPLAPEYGLIDTLGQAWGLYATFNSVYPDLYAVDYRREIPKVEVPTYFLAGRWDVNAFQTLTEDYWRRMEAPVKELHWFEDSGHNVIVQEPELLKKVLVERVLAQTYPKEH